jgi:hypothetical protein
MRDVVAAFRAALTAGGIARVYAPEDVPNLPTYPYVVVYGGTPTPGDYSHAATSASRAWRVATLYVGTSEDSCLWLAEKAEAALLDRRLTVANKACSKIKRSAGKPISPDPDVEDVSSGTDTWTFTTTNA